MKLTDKQMRTLRHMLGINDQSIKKPEPHRDYAAANPGDAEFAELARLGAVRCYRRAGESGGAVSTTQYDWFETTDAGRAAAIASHKSIRYPRSRRVYLKFLSVTDCYPDLTFREFLTSAEFADVRREA